MNRHKRIKKRRIKEITDRSLRLKEELQLLEHLLDGLSMFLAPNPIQKIKNKVTFMVNCETQYEHTVNKPVKFLRFIKRCPLYNTREMPKVLEPYRYVMKKGCADPECFLPVHDGYIEYRKPIRKNTKIKTSYQLSVELPVLKDSFMLPGPMNCLDICFVRPNLFWVNNGNNIILTNTKGDMLRSINSSYSFTANENEIMYVDRDFSIQNLSYDREKSILFVRRPSLWLPLSIHCCQSKGDLLVGMVSSISNPAKARIARYNELGVVKQSIYQSKEGRVLYRYPRYITENRNGDIVVSDVLRGRIVVTNYEGEFRFFSPVENPRGICTDRWSRILVVCRYSKDVLVLDKNGLFLIYLRIEESPGIVRTAFRNLQLMLFHTKGHDRKKLCLSYDDHKNVLWVGSNDSNTVSGYKEEPGGLTFKETLLLWLRFIWTFIIGIIAILKESTIWKLAKSFVSTFFVTVFLSCITTLPMSIIFFTFLYLISGYIFEFIILVVIVLCCYSLMSAYLL
uniref:Uncharacterized protein LOC111124854 isoform X1 n=1 Tax=Crassostrea virginica TaxID=6565 RepID=A0A8B8D8C0_CRAVI|nr:uncharacterized protein LOC111124854 isoform X1 [Crassostrea virginica]XP_022323783.1 uncharacterized protein LOC111124854 isoform X1 [Crassostrea virginica]XP_022323784.1 uncharacterized protein LOC111124854 isoform X1 [Crassostrea virginica]XP_022323785.1 uncharacterized protein LOC111124854 isoform X1 [Crassostrea virginica]XP_022323786.1 uncharacterized protein LOC111124854 isoform X1 [Crassostrea virginica]